MKSTLILILFFTAVSFSNLRATNITASGQISTNTTWSVDTVKVVGDITVMDGYKLIVNPGTKVEFEGFYRIFVAGCMQAIGNAVDTIDFTISDTTSLSDYSTTNGGWKGLNFDSVATPIDSSILSFCKIHYVKNGPTTNTIAGIRIANSSRVRVSNCVVSYNIFLAQMGGICCLNGSPAIYENRIEHNSGWEGGGIACLLHSHPIIRGNVIRYNYAQNCGGGIHCDQSPAIIISNFICNNSTKSSNCGPQDGAGGIRCTTSSNAYIANNVIANNSTGMFGGGIECKYASNAVILNNIIVNNNAYLFGGGINLYQSNPLIKNCIIYGNTRFTMGSPDNVMLYTDDSDPTIQNSCIEGDSTNFSRAGGVYYTGIYQNNISVSPQFNSPSAGVGPNFDGYAADWRLTTTSPCINTGNSYGLGSYMPTTDLYGNPRIAAWTIDMGVYEEPNLSGMNSLENNSELKIYPNPASDFVFVETNENYLVSTISILDVSGKLIDKKIFYNSEAIEMNTRNLESGIYFLEISIDNKVQHRKLEVN
jgi:hypothetical protein